MHRQRDDRKENIFAFALNRPILGCRGRGRYVAAATPSLVAVTEFAKRAVLLTGYDDVVKYVNFEELPRSNEVTCNTNVGFRWGRIAARMIVHDHNGRGAGNDGQGGRLRAGAPESCPLFPWRQSSVL